MTSTTIFRRKVCNNCRTVYPKNLRKCPTKGCRSTFFCMETDEQLAVRGEHRAKIEAIFDELVGAAA